MLVHGAPARAGTLRRRLSAIDGVAIGVGSVIGVGIFRTTGQVLRAAGGPGAAILVWIAVGLVNLAGASAFARVAVEIPEAGGPYAYVREALGRRVAFVHGWFGAGLSIPARQAAQMVVLGEVLALEMGGTARAWALALVGALYGVHLSGVRVGAGLQRILSVVKILLIVAAVVVAFCCPRAADASGEPSTAPAIEPLPIGVGLAAAFYTYLGWQDVTHLAEELREPTRSLPRVLLATVTVVVAVYVAWVVALTYAYGAGPVAQSDLPIRSLALATLGSVGRSIVTAGMFACMLGGAAEGVLVRPRLWYALARDGLAPRALGRVSSWGVPWIALTVQCALIGSLVALLGSLAELLVVLSLAQAITSSLEAASAIVLERRRGTSLPVRPSLFAVTNVGLATVLAVQNPGPFLAAVSLLALFACLARFAAPRATQPGGPRLSGT
jgi:amino acid transporter